MSRSLLSSIWLRVQISGHELARTGASLIVNDFGGGADGTGGAKGPADEVADARHVSDLSVFIKLIDAVMLNFASRFPRASRL